MTWNNLDEALAIARGFAEDDIALQRQIRLFRQIEEIIQPDRMFVLEKALDLSENDDQAGAYREAIDYNDGALFLFTLFDSNQAISPSQLYDALSFGWTSETYDDAKKWRMPAYREDKASFEPTDYFTLLSNNCYDEGQTFEQYVADCGGTEQFIKASLAGYYGSNLARALELLSSTGS